MSTVLVAGGAGYIGSMVSRELLARGHRVVAADALLFGGEALLDLLSHPDFAFRKVDVRDPQDLEALFSTWQFDAVVHLAAIVGDPACKAQPELATQTLWDGSRSLLELSDQHGVGHFVFASTCSNYGRMESNAVLDEDAPLRPVSLYAELKVRFEELLMARSVALDFTILRFATVYGLSLRPRFDLTINEFARDALLKGELEVFGPDFWRPYCHVRDIANAVTMILEQDRGRVAGRVFNVGADDENYQKRAIAEAVAEQIPVRLRYVERAEDPRDYRVSFERIAALGFTPRMRLRDGIREVAEAIATGLIADPYAARYRNS
ncbi:MAG TPA: NAD(P)-dependent oxidoreductase [Candidatus Limnocylindrales bacterium]